MTDKAVKLLNVLSDGKKVYIQPHNIPDPDSIASSFGLQYLLSYFNISSKIIHVDMIEKANSKKMLELFNINMEMRNQELSYYKDDYVILVDTQIGSSNLTALKCENTIVIDHHEFLGNRDYLFIDIQPDIGACSSIVSSYFFENDITPPVNVATALLYGIMMDTDNLTRRVSDLDIEMFYWLYNQSNINNIKLLKLNQIVKSDLVAYAKALDNIEIYGYIGFVHIENCNDSLLGTISDMVNTIEGVTVVVAYAKREDGVKFSIRSGSNIIQANKLIRFIIRDNGVGGGHKEMAGGFMPNENMKFLKDKELDTYVRHRVIYYVENEDENL